MPADSPPARTLSVVIPVYNEAAHIGATLEAVDAEVSGSQRFTPEYLVIDDGSTDGTAEAARGARTATAVRVIPQANGGRLAARRRGLAEASGDYVLFLDSRVTILPGSLSFAAEGLDRGESPWSADVRIDATGNPYGMFWNVLTEIAWAEYFDDPRTTSFNIETFDRYPKGTTCFLVPTELARAAFAQFKTAYRDERNANDDTPILRWIAAQTDIHVSPHFGCVYRPRSNMQGFLRHAYHRGIVFLDGHGHRDSRFFPVVAGFYPASVAATIASARRPVRAGWLVMMVAGAAAGVAAAKRRRPAEILAFSALSPVYAVAHGLGMWRGAALALSARMGPSSP